MYLPCLASVDDQKISLQIYMELTGNNGVEACHDSIKL